MAWSNVAKTVVFLGTAVLLAVLAGWAVGGAVGGVATAVVAVGGATAAYRASDRVVLRLAGARPLGPQEAPWLHAMVAEVAGRAGVPSPRINVVHSAQPNAMSVGRDPRHASVILTDSLVGLLTDHELRAVIAHELSHIRSRDTLTGGVAATAAAALTLVTPPGWWESRGGRRRRPRPSVMAILGWLPSFFLVPLAAFAVQMAVPRSRESHADRAAAQLVGDVAPMTTALTKICEATAGPGDGGRHVPAAAHLYIQTPLDSTGPSRMFLSHPSLDERLAQLRLLAGNITRRDMPERRRFPTGG